MLRSYAALLNEGEVLAFPTETFYGLLARIDRPAALQRIFSLKGRADREPLPVMAADDQEAMAMWAEVPETARDLIRRFWPGPLTIVLPAGDRVPESVTGGGGTVGVRVPGSAAARGLCAMAGGVLVATSANPSGRAPAMSPEQVTAYFGRAVIVAEGGALPPSKGSTVLLMNQWPPRVAREGEVDCRLLEEALGVPLTGRG